MFGISEVDELGKLPNTHGNESNYGLVSISYQFGTILPQFEAITTRGLTANILLVILPPLRDERLMQFCTSHAFTDFSKPVPLASRFYRFLRNRFPSVPKISWERYYRNLYQ